jgi:hypothetical protein
MATKKTTRGQRVTASAARSVSWLSLVAATTLGVGGVDHIRARIFGGEDLEGEGEMRLIVQSYGRGTLEGRSLPQETARPLGSSQRAITPEELKNGVDVSFLQLPADGLDSDSVVVAWVERGVPNLDYDALEARPPEGAFYGVARHGDGNVELRLTRT